MQVALGIAPVWTIVKIFFLVGLSVYLIFAFVIIRQTQIMTNTIKLQFEWIIKILAVIHFLLALGILVFAFISL